MDYDQLKNLILETANEMAARGYGWAQESIVLGAVRDKLALGERLPPQQVILTAWHELFREGKLSWGYDLDNPNWPFFHLPKKDAALVAGTTS